MPRSSLIYAFCLLLLCGGCSAGSEHISSVQSVEPVDIMGGRTTRLPSPSGRHVVVVESTLGKMTMTARTPSGVALMSPVDIDTPSQFSWSPDSSFFFINDGRGSSVESYFRLWQMRSGGFQEIDVVRQRAVAEYARRFGCRADLPDPNVWGTGWQTDSSHLLLSVEPIPGRQCADEAHQLSLIVDTVTWEMVSAVD